MNSDIRSIIEEAVSTKDVYEIVYTNKSMTTRIYHIYDASYSQEFGRSCIYAKCIEIEDEKRLNFACSRIQSIIKYWTNIINKDSIATVDGIYVFATLNDNHLAYELHRLNKDERIFKYFEGEHEHADSIPIAFHHINPFDPNSLSPGWKSFERNKDYNIGSCIAVSQNTTDKEAPCIYDELIDSGFRYFVYDFKYSCPICFDDPEYISESAIVRNEVSHIYPITLYTDGAFHTFCEQRSKEKE